MGGIGSDIFSDMADSVMMVVAGLTDIGDIGG